MDTVDYESLTDSQLYSLFMGWADLRAKAAIKASRISALQDQLLALDSLVRSLTTATPTATQNEVLTRVAAIVGYTRGSAETDSSVVTWAARYLRAMRSFGSLEDIIYCAQILFTSPSILTANEVGPMPATKLLNGGAFQVIVEDAALTPVGATGSIALINKLLELLSSIVEAVGTVALGINLTELYCWGSSALPNWQRLPAIWMGGIQTINTSSTLSGWSVGDVMTTTNGTKGVVKSLGTNTITVSGAFDQVRLHETLTSSRSGSPALAAAPGSIVTSAGNQDFFRFDGNKILGTLSAGIRWLVVGETLTDATSGATGIVTDSSATTGVTTVSLAEMTGVFASPHSCNGSVSGTNCITISSVPANAGHLDGNYLYTLIDQPQQITG